MSTSHTNSNEAVPNNLLVLVGSGLLLIGLVNILHILSPLKFGKDPVWEAITLGKLVDIAPVLIVGISFIFYGESKWINLRLDKELTRLFLLRNLSRLSLLLSLGYFIMFFIGSVAATRISRFVLTKNLGELQQSSQAKQTTENRVDGKDKNFGKNGQVIGVRSPSIGSDKPNSTDSANKSIELFTNSQKNIEENFQVTEDKDNVRLFAQIGKWCVEAAISTGLLFGIWYQTEWARNPSRPKRKRSRQSSTSSDILDYETKSDNLDN